MAIPDRFLRVAAVSYEGSVFGWDINAVESTLESTLRFGFHATQGSLKALAVSASGKFMITGGMDERIRIFNVAENKNLGELTGHTGCVTCLSFVGDQFVVSGSEDTTLGIWRVQDWMCVHMLGGHKAAVSDLAVHPSGKLALSVSKDNTLKVWNLVQGRCAFTRRLHGPADKVRWSANGELYLLVVGSELQVYNAADNACIGTVKFSARINQACFTDIGVAAVEPAHQYVAVICEDKKLIIVKENGEVLLSPYSLDAVLVGGRPRDMHSCAPAVVSSGAVQAAMEGEGHSLIVVTSSGALAVLSARALAEGNQGHSEEEEEEDVGGASFALQTSAVISAEPRLTAVVAWNPAVVLPRKGLTVVGAVQGEPATDEEARKSQRQEALLDDDSDEEPPKSQPKKRTLQKEPKSAHNASKEQERKKRPTEPIKQRGNVEKSKKVRFD